MKTPPSDKHLDALQRAVDRNLEEAARSGPFSIEEARSFRLEMESQYGVSNTSTSPSPIFGRFHLSNGWVTLLSAAAILLLGAFVWSIWFRDSGSGGIVSIPGEIVLASSGASEQTRGAFGDANEFSLKLVLESGRESLGLIGGRTIFFGSLTGRTNLSMKDVQYGAVLTNVARRTAIFHGKLVVGLGAASNKVEFARLDGKVTEAGKPDEEFNRRFDLK